MLKLIVCTIVVVAVSGQGFNGGDSDWYCTAMKTVDCMAHKLDERCGTDGKTYRNMCDLGKGHCTNNTVNQYHLGPCVQVVTTTLSPQQIVHGSQIILDFQCAALSHTECVNAYNEKICGTDGRTYSNFCEYEKSRCTHRNLHVAHLGDCSA